MDIVKLMRNGILGDYKIKDPQFKEYIDHVLTKIPESYEEDFPDFSIYEGSVRWGAMVADSSVTFDVYRIKQLCDDSESALIGLIAHEFAHVFCEHGKADHKVGLEVEDEADNLACKWGFKKEIEDFRNKIKPNIDDTVYPNSTG